MESTGRKGLIRLLKYLNEEEIIKKKGGEKEGETEPCRRGGGGGRLVTMEGCSDGGHGTRLVFVNAVDKEREKRREKVYFEFYSDLLRLMPIIRMDHLRFCRTNCAK